MGNRSIWGQLALACTFAVLLSACGGGGGGSDAPSAPASTTIDNKGGTVFGEGVALMIPPGAMTGSATIRIAKDSIGAPPLPPGATPAGAVFSITPHGASFNVHVEVSIPVERTEFANNEQLLLVTVEPGQTQWRVLSGATYANGALRAPVMHFSFFQAITLTDLTMPTLVTTMGGQNNVGASSIGRFSPDYEFNQTSALQVARTNLLAQLTVPTASIFTRAGVSNPTPVRTCLPSSYGHGGAEWRFMRDGIIIPAPDALHYAAIQRPEGEYPRVESEVVYNTVWSSISMFASEMASGFGALHFYGQDAPRRGALMPAGSSDLWALPPTGNSTNDDLLTWYGSVLFTGEQQNGRVRIDLTVPTDCGLFLEAVPISFQLNLGSRNVKWHPYTGVASVYYGLAMSAPAGDTAVLPFREEFDGTSMSIAWEFSRDLVNWQKQAVPENLIRDDGGPSLLDPYFSLYPYAHRYSIVIPNLQPEQAGWYRAWACSKSIPADGGSLAIPSLCMSRPPVQLVVLTVPPKVTQQPAAQSVLVGETASFWMNIDSYPGAASVQWQKRSLAAAAFGFGAWTTIDGAVESFYTTPAATLDDNGTQFRAVVTTVLGSSVSDSAILTVLDQLRPPVIESQPGNLNTTVGSTAVFAVTVSGTGPLSYQWLRNGSSITGANSPILTLSNVSALNDGRYQLVVTNRVGAVTSESAVLLVTLGTPAALPPTIAAPPASITVAAGNAANFAVAVNGTGPYTYMWMKNGVQAPIPNGDMPSFSIASVSVTDAGTYSVRVTNTVGAVISAAATLTVGSGTGTLLAPTIVTAPVSLAVLPGGGATFAVAVTGTAPFTYQWRHNGTDIVGATGSVLSFAAVTSLDAGQYAVEVRNAAGVVSSSAVSLIVVGAPLITQQPTAASAIEGSAATMSVIASGDGLLYQWTRNQIGISGATTSIYTTPVLSLSDNGAVYGVIVYNGAGLLFSQDAVLTVTPMVMPSFTTQPAGQGVVEPASATFSVIVSGSPVPTMQWQVSTDGGGVWTDIPGATSNSYTTLPTTVADSGRKFRAVATNAAGSVNSNAVTLTVTATVTPATGFPVGSIAFSANDGVNGAELWMTDGSAVGTVLVKDIYPGVDGSGPESITRFGSLVVFRAYDAVKGRTLWRSDGTAAGTVMLADLNFPTNLIVCNASLFFAARDASGNALWKTDGTAAGTVRLASISVTTDITQTVACVNGVLFVSASDTVHGTELWRSDGSVAGTTLVRDILAGADGSSPSDLVAFLGQLYFKANGALWRSDGTTDGTTLVSSDGFNPRHLTVNGPTLYFGATTAGTGYEPWKSDGTPGGTTMIRDLQVGTASSYASSFTVSAGVTYFAAAQVGNSVQLWRTDGSAAGTSIVKQIDPGSVATFGDGMIDVNGTLYFYANDSATGSELWKTDGTAAGTVLVKDIFPGVDMYGSAFGSTPTSFMKVGGTLLFSASMSGIGTELWRTDGSEAGTVLLKDICAGTCSSNPVP